MALNTDVLPAPFGPMTAVMESACTLKLTPGNAFTPPNVSVKLTTSIEEGTAGTGGLSPACGWVQGYLAPRPASIYFWVTEY